MESPEVVVIGAGAAGIIASWRSASLGARTLLLEKTNRIGTKILISGGGKCNITHAGEIPEVLRAFRPNEAKFIRPACYRFTNRQIVQMLTDRGLKVYTRPDGRIFPVDQTAKDVVAILRRYLADAEVDVQLSTPVEGLEYADGRITGVRVAGSCFTCTQVVLATGGSSYPNSGTTGDGWPWVKELGLEIVRVRAALAPIYLERDFAELSGVALRDVILKARAGTKEIERWRGDLLFTHRGISGPTALGVSRVVTEWLDKGPVTVEVDSAPDQSFESLSDQVRNWCHQYPRRRVLSFVEELLPSSVAEQLWQDLDEKPETTGQTFGQKSKNRLVEMLKGWKLGVVRAVPLEKGECVAGGVALEEVDPQTMKAHTVQGLYLCGEVLDIAGPVGGYNLQAAFATGYVAGEEAARAALSQRSG